MSILICNRLKTNSFLIEQPNAVCGISLRVFVSMFNEITSDFFGIGSDSMDEQSETDCEY